MIKKLKSESASKLNKKLIIDTNRRLQETTQELFMAKQELENKNRELRDACKRESIQKEKLEQLEHTAMKRLAGPINKEKTKRTQEKKLTRSIAEGLSLRYIELLRAYISTREIERHEPLIEEFCRKLLEYGVTPKGIIDLHIKAISQIKTVNESEARKLAFEARMALLAVMTKYAGLLRD
ncbi:MAG: phosphatase RsbU N-terminal domain-containing protein, partial [Candidatus Omnitrophota bacterium]